MVKKISALLVCFIGLTIFFVSISHSQGSMKTITLPNGEVIWDLNGEWDIRIERYGLWSIVPSSAQDCKITQEGSSVVGIRMIGDDLFNPKGSEILRGELDKSGFKKVQLIFTRWGPMDAKGQISEDGNKMIIDDGAKVRMTYTRKK
jgi:hypothetical protein